MRKTKIAGVFLLCVMVFFVGNAYGIFVGNRGCDGILPPLSCGGDGITTGRLAQTPGELIKEAAYYFLNSNSKYLETLKCIEFEEFSTLTDETMYSAVDLMTNANDTYEQLCVLLSIAEWDKAYLESLKKFDYSEFQKAKGLNSTVFNEVKEYLSEGDVKGLFGNLKDRTAVLLAELIKVTPVVEAKSFDSAADIDKLWRINQMYAETLLFGQYAAEVFYAIAVK